MSQEVIITSTLISELGFPRTQNHAESWHNRWKTLLGRPHVGIYSMIKELQKEHHAVRALIEKVNVLGRQRSTYEIKRARREEGLRHLLTDRITLKMPHLAFMEKMAFRLK